MCNVTHYKCMYASMYRQALGVISYHALSEAYESLYGFCDNHLDGID